MKLIASVHVSPNNTYFIDDSMVLRLLLHAVYYAKNETSEKSLYMYMFIDARPFISLQAFKLCFCLEDPQD